MNMMPRFLCWVVFPLLRHNRLVAGTDDSSVSDLKAHVAALREELAAAKMAKDAGPVTAAHAVAANAHDVISNGFVREAVPGARATPNGVRAASRPAKPGSAESHVASGGGQKARRDAVSAAEAASASALSGIKAWGKPRSSPSASINTN